MKILRSLMNKKLLIFETFQNHQIRPMTKFKNPLMLKTLLGKHKQILIILMQNKFPILKRQFLLQEIKKAYKTNLRLIIQRKYALKILINDIIIYGGQSTRQLIDFISRRLLWFLYRFLNTVKQIQMCHRILHLIQIYN